ncbi:MAG: HAD hydrolase family protein [Patescibacteria group bacterium]
MKYKALVSDIDGTLTKLNPNALPSDVVTSAIKNAVNNGLIFSLATGRPCIVDNGAVIVDSKDGSVLWEAVLTNEHANRILEMSQGFELFRASCDTGGLEKPLKVPEGSKVRKISVHDITLAQAEDLIKKVSDELKDVACIKAASYKGDHLVDVYFSHSNATKQHAVFELANILGISNDEIIGIGDGYNDFPLLMGSGLKVAMGNAVSELKEIADYIAPTVDDDGLADVISKYCS